MIELIDVTAGYGRTDIIKNPAESNCRRKIVSSFSLDVNGVEISMISGSDLVEFVLCGG